MTPLQPKQRDESLHISEAKIEEVKTLHQQGMSLEALVATLAGQGVPKPGTQLLLRLAGVASLGDAKRIVHRHPAYAWRRDSDEAFVDAAIEAVSGEERFEAA